METRTCSYCFREKAVADFSYEHIWPNALGGDNLPPPWHTRNVCAQCNNNAGLFVDGEFCKSWFGNIERVRGTAEFLDPAAADRNRFPPHFVGKFDHPDLDEREVAELWLGPCGAHMVHIRLKDEPEWNTFIGGSPLKKSWGSAFLALTSSNPFWMTVSVNSFHHFFKSADRVITNSTCPKGFSPPFSEINPSDVDQVRKLRVANSIGEAALNKTQVKTSFSVKADFGTRLMVKLALGLGRELLGLSFLQTSYASTLRRALWERNAIERLKLPVRGSGYLAETIPRTASSFLSWPNAWTLILQSFSFGLVLVVGTPTGRTMSILVFDEESPLEQLNSRFDEGEVYITIPALNFASKQAISLPSFIAHLTKLSAIPELVQLASQRQNPELLPPCK